MAQTAELITFFKEETVITVVITEDATWVLEQDITREYPEPIKAFASLEARGYQIMTPTWEKMV